MALTELRNRNLLQYVKSNTIEYIKLIREPLLTLYFCVTKLGSASIIISKIERKY